MATTIQISDEVQKRLFQFINQKEKELGRRITYNDAITLLLEKQPAMIEKRDLINHVEQYQGIMNITDAKKARQEERKLARERESNIEH
jgi:predicted CopG family antitoxin